MRKKKVLLICFAAAFLMPQNTHAKDAGFMDFLFPSLRTYDEDPSVTMMAPFAKKNDESNEGAQGGVFSFLPPSPDNTVPLHRQHRLNNEIEDWLGKKIPVLLALSRSGINKELQDVKALFVPAAWQQYLTVLKDFGALQALQNGSHDVRAFTEAKPSVLTQDSLEGRYMWLLRVPVTMTLLDKNANDYSDLSVVNRRMDLTIQLGRYENAPEPGVLIERWEAKEKDN